MNYVSCFLRSRIFLGISFSFAVACSPLPSSKSAQSEEKAKAATEPSNTNTSDTEEAASPSKTTGIDYWGATVTIGTRPPWEAFSTMAETPVLGSHAPKRQSFPVSATTWNPQEALELPETWLASAEFSPDGKQVAVFGRMTGTIYLLSTESGNILKAFQVPGFNAGEPAAITFVDELADHQFIAVSRVSGTELLDIDDGSFKSLGLAAAGSDIMKSKHRGLYGIDNLNSGGSRLTLQWLTSEVAATVNTKFRASDWSLSEDGRILAMLYDQEQKVELIHLEKSLFLAEVPTPAEPKLITLAPGGLFLAIGGKTLEIFSLITGEIIDRDETFRAPISKVRFSPQEDLLLVASSDGLVHSYPMPNELSTLTKLPEPQILNHAPGIMVYDVRISEDGTQLVSVSSDKLMRRWTR